MTELTSKEEMIHLYISIADKLYVTTSEQQKQRHCYKFRLLNK